MKSPRIVQPTTHSLIRDIAALLFSLFRFGRNRIWLLLLLVFLSSLVDGLGLVLIFPLAAIVFEDIDSENRFLSDVMVFLENFGLETTVERLWLFSGLYLLLVLLRTAVLMLREAKMADFQNRFINHERMTLYRILAFAPWPVISNLDQSNILNALTSNLSRIGVCIHFFFSGVVQLMHIVILLSLTALLNIFLFFALLGLGFVSLLICVIWVKRSHRLGEESTGAGRELMSETNVFLAGLKTAKIYAAEEIFLSRFETVLNKTRIIGRSFALQQGRLRRGMEILTAIVMLSIFLVGYIVIDVSGAALLAIAAILLRLTPQLISLTQGLQTVANAAPAFTAARAIREQIERETPVEKPESGQSDTHIGRGPIHLQNVSVTVPEGDGTKTLLQIDDLLLPETGFVLVQGPSGAGKSTFAEMLCGLRDHETGVIQVNGQTLSRNMRRPWQTRISFLPQEPFLLRGSVRDNLAWPTHEIDDQTAWQALTASNARSVVEFLPKMLDTDIRDRGMRLSGGERQRLCLARTLVRDAWIYILDEPTANLDEETERIIIDNLQAKANEQLVILISHDPGFRTAADLILTIKEGRFVDLQPADKVTDKVSV